MQLSEFMQEFDRMCFHYSRRKQCSECPMNGANISQCRKIVFEQPYTAEETVSNWAKDNPKPPTWLEWLGSHGIAVRGDGSLCFDRPSDANKPVPEALWKE